MPRAAQAMRIGADAACALAETRRGRLAAVYRHAAALVLEDGTHLGLLPDGAPLHPWALSADVVWREEDAGLSAKVAEQVLQIGQVQIALSGAAVMPLRLRARPARWPGALFERLGGVDLPTSAFSRALAIALSRLDGGEIGGLWELSGVGEGLTPSGDDILVGILAAWDYLGDCRVTARSWRRELLDAWPRDLDRRTARLAAQLLGSAAAGSYAAPLLALLEAAEADEGTWTAALAGTLACGHRSGADLVFGLARGVQAVASGSPIAGLGGLR